MHQRLGLALDCAAWGAAPADLPFLDAPPTGALAARATDAAARFEAYTQEAIEGQVFGAPWYVVDGEPFWGEDRLEFVDAALARGIDG